MTTTPFTPKFLSPETLLKKRTITCERCGDERVLPEGKVQMIGICAACCLEVEYLAKKYQGRLKEGEERPRRDIPRKIEKVAPTALLEPLKPKLKPAVSEVPKDFITPYPNQ